MPERATRRYTGRRQAAPVSFDVGQQKSNKKSRQNMNTKLAARWAGAFYFLIIAGAILTLIFIDSALIVAGDTEATVNNIRAKEFLYRVGVAADTIMFCQVVLLTVFLYIVLRTVNKDLAFLALLLRFAEGILGAAATLVGGIAPLLLLRYESSFDPGQLNAFNSVFSRPRGHRNKLCPHLYGFGGDYLLLSVFGVQANSLRLGDLGIDYLFHYVFPGVC